MDANANELPDTAEAMQAKETEHALPLGFALLFLGIVAWGVVYLWLYSPWSTGWTQAGELTGGAEPPSITATILFTAIPTAVAIGLWLASSRRKRP
jgi:hypothetical protein